jgi:putative transposase
MLWVLRQVLVIIDEYSRECLALYAPRHIKALDVIDVFSELMLERDAPGFIMRDNGLEFVASELRNWLKSLGTQTAYITLGSTWENGFCERLNGKFRGKF